MGSSDTNIKDIFIIYIPGARGFGEILPEGNIIIEGKISPNPPSGGYINAFIYRKNTWNKKKEMFIFKTNNANSRRFGELELHTQNHIPWSYSPLRSYTTHTRKIRL